MNMHRIFRYICLGLFVFLVDRISKYIVLHNELQSDWPHSPVQCVLSFNRGISWGVFNYDNSFPFFLICLIIITVLSVLITYTSTLYKAGHSIIGPVLIIAGAFSNLIDRIWYHAVIDFIAVSGFGFSFPIFNIADAAIVIGAFLMFYEGCKQ